MAKPSPTRATGAPPTDALIQALMEDADAGALLLEQSGTIVRVNPAAARLFGMSASKPRGAAAAHLVRTAVAWADPVRAPFRSARRRRSSASLRAPRRT